MLPSAHSRTSLGKTSPPLDIPHTFLTDDRSVEERYEFCTKLGEGSFGVVHEVLHRDSKQRWACKVINKEKAGGPKIKLINREVGILKQVHHAHIIQLREILETPQKMYLVMELCEGGELSKFLQRAGGRLSEREVRVVMERLASAIAYLHKDDFVHRDLKLENVLLSRNPTDPSDNLYIKVTDFGLSVIKGGVSTDDMMNDFCGTLLYMAPEIMENKMYSEKCDVWAMGIIMCLLLIGSSPFPANSDLAQENIDVKIKGKEWSEVSVRARDCVSRMLQTDTAHRFAASEVLQHAFIKDQPLEAVPQTNVLDLMKKFRDEKPQQSDEEQTEGAGTQTEEEVGSGQNGPRPITFTANATPNHANSAPNGRVAPGTATAATHGATSVGVAESKAATLPATTRRQKTLSVAEYSKPTEKTRPNTFLTTTALPPKDIRSSTLPRAATTARGEVVAAGGGGKGGSGTKDRRTVEGGDQKRPKPGAATINGGAAVNGAAHGEAAPKKTVKATKS